MGGKLYTDQSRRIKSKTEYLQVVSKQKLLLKGIADPLVPRQISSKQSFGDIDMLVPDNTLEAIKELLIQNKLLFILNGNVLSYLSNENIQIDLICLPEDTLTYALDYFSYGDQGNILGRLLKQFEYKNSFLGLYYIFERDNGNYRKEILLSDKYIDVLNLLELDVIKFYKGFETEEDLFQWVISSPYFNKDIYLFENLNNKSRTRNKKRKGYNSFLTFIKDKEFNNNTLNHPLINFPKAKKEYINHLTEYNEIQHFKKLFNANIVSEQTGLQGKELGLFMKYFNEKYIRQDLKFFTPLLIKTLIQETYNEFRRITSLS